MGSLTLLLYSIPFLCSSVLIHPQQKQKLYPLLFLFFLNSARKRKGRGRVIPMASSIRPTLSSFRFSRAASLSLLNHSPPLSFSHFSTGNFSTHSTLSLLFHSPHFIYPPQLSSLITNFSYTDKLKLLPSPIPKIKIAFFF